MNTKFIPWPVQFNFIPSIFFFIGSEQSDQVVVAPPDSVQNLVLSQLGVFYHVAWDRKKTEESSTNRDHDSRNCQHIWDLYWLLLWYMQSILRKLQCIFCMIARLPTRFGRKDFAPVGPFNITWTTSGSDSGFLSFFLVVMEIEQKKGYAMGSMVCQEHSLLSKPEVLLEALLR